MGSRDLLDMSAVPFPTTVLATTEPSGADYARALTIASRVAQRRTDTLERLALSDRLDRLAANLAVAGALCAAFFDGFEEGWTGATRHPDPEWATRGEFKRAMSIGDDDAHDWRPGCGRAWGGGV